MWLIKLLAAVVAIACAAVIFAWAVEKLPKNNKKQSKPRRKQ